MPNFHALAVFEAGGASTEDIQAEVSSLLGSFSHQRVHYYAHEMSESPNASAADAGRVHCMVFVDCDVDAHTEEKAMELADDLFDHISTQTCTYLALGLLAGRPRVSHRREDIEATDETRSDADRSERRDRQGRGRRRGGRRGQGRRGEADDDRPSEERGRESAVKADRPRRPRSAPREEADARAATEADSTQTAATSEPIVAASEPAPHPAQTHEPERGVHETPDAFDVGDHADDAPTELEVALDSNTPAAPPQRSSNAMQITVTVKLRASELTAAADDTEASSVGVDEAELLRLAISEARGRHPEVPADVSPECETAPLPGGDSLLSLTWKYPAPVPSSRSET